MSAIVRWEDPPPPYRGRSRPPQFAWADACQELARHPHRWALVATIRNSRDAAQYALMLRQGRLGGMGAALDAVARTVDGESRVYARWVGDPS